MIYRFEFSPHADHDFSCLELSVQRRILTKLDFFESLSDPLKHAKKLVGVVDVYRYRIGNYRVLVAPMDKKTLVIFLVVKIGYRRDVYDE